MPRDRRFQLHFEIDQGFLLSKRMRCAVQAGVKPGPRRNGKADRRGKRTMVANTAVDLDVLIVGAGISGIGS
ncbi:hypothetical protein VJI72_08695, partial [Parvimonas micra]|uniref:hypothetical protein n=1 Tax=Parvimonas micra TaxID=33033 RepID=UPI002B4820BB